MPRFKLTDLLAVTFVLLIATAAFLPAAEKVNEEAARKVCMSHLMQVGKAFLLYSNENKGLLPRTVALPLDDKDFSYNFFTNPNIAKADEKAADTDPMGEKGPKPNDITGAIYLLLRTQDLTPDVFLCPSASGEVAMPRRAAGNGLWRLADEPVLEFHKQTNFPSPKYLDYSFVNMYPDQQANAARYKIFITAFASDFAIGADLNPGTKELTSLTPKSPAADLKASNSTNHGGAGQNVLYADSHVEFQTTPLCGATESNVGMKPEKLRAVKDNIYTFGVNSDDKGGEGVVGSPADAVDSVLLPSAVERAAAMPKDAKK
jgi:prepilin-type processing-associated H-X9-DG protein